MGALHHRAVNTASKPPQKIGSLRFSLFGQPRGDHRVQKALAVRIVIEGHPLAGPGGREVRLEGQDLGARALATLDLTRLEVGGRQQGPMP